MGIVKAAFLVTVYAEDDDYATYAAPARTDWSNAEVQSWLSQNYYERLEDALDVGDRPNTLSWTVDTLPYVEVEQDDEDLAHFDNALAIFAEVVEESNQSGKGYRDFL